MTHTQTSQELERQPTALPTPLSPASLRQPHQPLNPQHLPLPPPPLRRLLHLPRQFLIVLRLARRPQHRRTCRVLQTIPVLEQGIEGVELRGVGGGWEGGVFVGGVLVDVDGVVD